MNGKGFTWYVFIFAEIMKPLRFLNHRYFFLFFFSELRFKLLFSCSNYCHYFICLIYIVNVGQGKAFLYQM
jgi:hypothetical protein